MFIYTDAYTQYCVTNREKIFFHKLSVSPFLSRDDVGKNHPKNDRIVMDANPKII